VIEVRTEGTSDIYKRLEEIEREIESMKTFFLLQRSTPQKDIISLRGIAKLLVSDENLERSIEEAKRSFFKGTHDVLSD